MPTVCIIFMNSELSRYCVKHVVSVLILFYLCLCYLDPLKISTCRSNRSRDIAVGIPTSYGLDGRGGRSSSPGGIKNFLFSTSSRPGLGSTQPPIQWARGVNPPGREADHSPPANAEDKKTWIYTSTPPYAFMA
jgi:hypothetical protein